LRTIGALAVAVLVVASACSSTASPAAGGGSAIGKQMTDAEVKAAVAAEGTVNVGNWTYSATAEIVNQFQKYVKDTYGADIKLNYVGSQQPSEYLTKLAADQKAGNKASFDVIAVEENYWYDASQQGLVDDALNSKLIPNAALVLDAFKHAPQSIAFQSTAYPAIVYNKDKAGFLTKLMDLADPRLKGKVTSIKAALVDQRLIAGIGNIYACEALFRAGISPLRLAGTLATKTGKPTKTIEALVKAVKAVLGEAIKAGGSTLRDYARADGRLGRFQHSFKVYGREGKPCRKKGCRGTVRRIVQSGRSTFYCPNCQR